MPPTSTTNRFETLPIWQARAACKGLDPTIFYPVDDEFTDVDKAKEICGECPVSEACLEHALDRREKNGVWGGMTAGERRRLLRQRRRSA